LVAVVALVPDRVTVMEEMVAEALQGPIIVEEQEGLDGLEEMEVLAD
jgi:hypothetical protein